MSANAVALATVIASPLSALLVGLIAAASASNRQRDLIKDERERFTEQIQAERRRLDDQLEAERARLDQQLNHERHIKDLDALRILLDEALGTMTELSKAVAAANVVLKDHKSGDLLSEPKLEDLQTVKAVLGPAILETIDLQVRMQVRVSDESPLYLSFRDFCRAAEATHSAIHGAESRAPDEVVADVSSTADRMNKAASKFRSAAVEVARLRTPTPV